MSMSLHDGDFGGELSADEEDALHDLASRLVAERPLPGAAYRGELRRRLVNARPPSDLRRRAAVFLATGVALLAVAALGALGSGPLAPTAVGAQQAQVSPR